VAERPYKRWTSEMDGALAGLKSALVAEVDSYITGSLKQWVIQEVYSVAYRNRVKARAQALLGTYELAVREAREKLEEEQKRCATESEIAALVADMQQLKTAKTNLVAVLKEQPL
jgi:cbb3-type cytochrome oxidase cytochrome c subunit